MRIRFPSGLLFGSALALGLGACGAYAQDWPQRPVTVVVPFAAGGNTDGIARMAAQRLTETLGKQFVVENRPGNGYAVIQRLVKRLLLGADNFLHLLFLGADFGEDVAHRVGEHVHEFVEERFVEAERAAIAHRAAQDAAKDIIPVVVARLDTVGDGKAQRADVIGNHAEGNVS